MKRSDELLHRYAAVRARFGLGAAEAAQRPCGELELQARFYAGEFGFAWIGVDGERVEAVHLGEWNREPGPDFVGARIFVDGNELEGDIELDPEDLDWERHGHSVNPAFEGVVLHVFFRAGRKRCFTRTPTSRSITQVLLATEPSGRQRFAGDGKISPLPHAAVATIVEAAAGFRLARKRERWLRAEALHGRTEALFQALAGGMGYKNNKVPFLLVAQRVSLPRARNDNGESLLFGVAGFLEADQFDRAAAETRGYSRGLWDAWWAVRHREARLQLPAHAWSTAAQRPQNHPHRRMGALAAIATNFSEFESALAAADTKAFAAALAGLRHPFWQTRSSLDGKPLARACALVGSQRTADLAANVLAPAASGGVGMEILRQTKAGSPSGKVRRAIKWLGGDPSLLTTALGQQGLLQVYEDFHPTDADELMELLA